MDDSPQPLPSGTIGNDQTLPQSAANLPEIGSISGKEFEALSPTPEHATMKDTGGQEIELPKEVISAGVKVQPTTVQLPQNVTNMGVTAVGNSVVTQAPAVALPLTDDQIALGLKQSIVSSWRWLAEFCVRRLKQFHKKIHA